MQSKDASQGREALDEFSSDLSPDGGAPDCDGQDCASAEQLVVDPLAAVQAIGQRLGGIGDLLKLFQVFGSGANFAGLGKIFDLIERLGGLDQVLPAVRNILAALQALAQVTEPVDTVAGLRQRLTFLLQAADAVSELTPNAYDNQVIEFAQQAVANDAVLTLIVLVLQKRRQAGPSGGDKAGESPFDFVRAAREALSEL